MKPLGSAVSALLLALPACLAAQPAASSQPAAAPPAVKAPAAAPVVPAPGPADQVDQARLLASLKMLPTKRAARSDQENAAGLVRTQDLLIEQLRALGYEPQTEVVDAIGLGRNKEHPFLNIWVEIKGTQHATDKAAPSVEAVSPATAPSSKPGESNKSRKGDDQAASAPGLLIVSAHIDAVPRAPGADDDGTGVAALLEMARILKSWPMKNDVRLCFFNLEECGLIGATVHARSVKEDLVDTGKARVIGMISMDMLGYYSDEPGSQRSPLPEMAGWKPPDVADFIAMATTLRHRKFSQALTKAMIAASPGLKVVTVDFLPIALPDLLRSDHAPFLLAGMPAVIVSDTADFRSKHYHQPTDTIETLDMKRFTMTVKGLVGGVHQLAVPAETSPKTPAGIDATTPPPTK